MSEVVLLTHQDRVATLTLHRPKARNALSPKVLQSVVDHCQTLALDKSVRVVVLRGAGKGFRFC